MNLTLLAADKGVGLAAPQIGVSKRAIVFKDQEHSGSLVTMINPEITERSKDTVEHEEGCLSYPKIYKNITRSKEVSVTWQTESKLKETRTFRDLNAVIIQHEIDHLDGTCLVGDVYKNLTEYNKRLVRKGKKLNFQDPLIYADEPTANPDKSTVLPRLMDAQINDKKNFTLINTQ